jgi:hypothetical protein
LHYGGQFAAQRNIVCVERPVFLGKDSAPVVAHVLWQLPNAKNDDLKGEATVSSAFAKNDGKYSM